ncbi:anthranilate synthase component I [candidate division GN15 bacterium]|nr:anthranilate synthase component I [candidate division GN15 bacterium]
MSEILSYTEARRLNKKGNVVPLSLRVPSDLETPVSAFMKLARGKRHSFLLESIEGGEKLARYSFIGFDPFLIVANAGGEVVLSQGHQRRRLPCTAHEFMDELFAAYKPVPVDGLPRFTGGAVGYFAYDTIRWQERIPDNNPDEINMPEMLFGMYATILAFDHLRQEIVLIANILHDQGTAGFKAKYTAARERLEALQKSLSRPLRQSQVRPTKRQSKIVAWTPQKDFEKAVRKAKRYIKEGDIFQVVLSQRWTVESNRTSLDIYRRLRRINPSPYMFLLNFGERAVIGASPEMLARVEGGKIETRPIAGTRPRGRTDSQDDKHIADLLSDTKELAEHTMLLDLGRNDVGRVSKPGSVEVADNMIIEKYSHVIHIVSSVTGRLQHNKTALDGFYACFPAGTVSGAPKVRAMEIIDELEPLRRGVYAGAVTYLDFWGNLDSCISIRTIVKDGHEYHIQAGAGIVADSKPAREFRETEAKAGALIEAVAGD